MEIIDYVKIAVEALKDKKGEKVDVIDISEVSTLADYFVIASGDNVNQIRAMSDECMEKLSKAGLKGENIEGYDNANWILLDYKDVVIHIFDSETRAMYDLERIWGDGKKVELK